MLAAQLDSCSMTFWSWVTASTRITNKLTPQKLHRAPLLQTLRFQHASPLPAALRTDDVLITGQTRLSWLENDAALSILQPVSLWAQTVYSVWLLTMSSAYAELALRLQCLPAMTCECHSLLISFESLSETCRRALTRLPKHGCISTFNGDFDFHLGLVLEWMPFSFL